MKKEDRVHYMTLVMFYENELIDGIRIKLFDQDAELKDKHKHLKSTAISGVSDPRIYRFAWICNTIFLYKELGYDVAMYDHKRQGQFVGIFDMFKDRFGVGEAAFRRLIDELHQRKFIVKTVHENQGAKELLVGPVLDEIFERFYGHRFTESLLEDFSQRLGQKPGNDEGVAGKGDSAQSQGFRRFLGRLFGFRTRPAAGANEDPKEEEPSEEKSVA